MLTAEKKSELLDVIVRQMVLRMPIHKLVQLMSADGWGWTEVFPDHWKFEEDSFMSVLDSAFDDTDDFLLAVKPYLGEALAKALGAHDVVIEWEQKPKPAD